MKLVTCQLKQRGGMAERIKIKQMEPKPARRPVECTYAQIDEQHFCPCYSAGVASRSSGPRSTA